ncbi:MAG: hypothetical protein KDK76_07720 [Chlamydiia bacterium]|nr:hypothetical protein [Chlamydiia bacterium]
MDRLQAWGYQNPYQTCERVAWSFVAATLAATAAKLFIPSANFKSHLLFGGGAGVTWMLLWENKTFEDALNDQNESKRKTARAVAFILQSGASLMVGRVLTSLFIERISFKNMLWRGGYLVGWSTAVTYGYKACREKARSG